ncbi:MAG: helix-turn-helix transcriptional regulator [Agathobacter sp.]|nr:helix-turn-helix transcriptional regulator [Agathobacter sp.]
MESPRSINGGKNLISERLIELRNMQGLSQRDLARLLQFAGYDMNKNVITRIETGKRFVTNIALQGLAQVLDTAYAYLIDGTT